MTVSDGQREQLAAALAEMLTGATGIATHGYWIRRAERLLADGGAVQRIADQRAAQALREAAAQEDPGPAWRLRRQADALDPT
jgi:hypothetical protein